MPDNSYFAGFFDGEGYVGCICIKVGEYYSLKVTVTNNNRDILELYRCEFGGSIKHPSENGSKCAWTWYVHGKNLVAFLKAIQPYVIVKKPQVDIALTFPFGRPGQRRTQAMRERRRHIYRELKRLKSEVYTETGKEESTRKALEEDPVVQEAMKIYLRNHSTQEVADELGVGQGAVAYWARQLKMSRSREEAGKIASRNSPLNIHHRDEVKEAVRLYESGMSASAVARELGHKPATVNYWLRRLGKTRTLSEAQGLRRQHEAA